MEETNTTNENNDVDKLSEADFIAKHDVEEVKSEEEIKKEQKEAISKMLLNLLEPIKENKISMKVEQNRDPHKEDEDPDEVDSKHPPN